MHSSSAKGVGLRSGGLDLAEVRGGLVAESSQEGGDQHPQRERILALSQRLENLQSSLSLESTKRFDTLMEKVRALNDRIEEVREVEEDLTERVLEKAQKIERDIEEERRERDAEALKHTQRVKAAETQLMQELKTNVSSARGESEEWMVRILDEATASLRSEFAKEMRLLDAQKKEFASITAKDLPSLGNKLNQLRTERKAMELRLVQKRERQINHLKMSILEEKRLREELEEAILRMLSDIAEALQRELETEKKQRDSTEESLISVLEETCSKLQIM